MDLAILEADKEGARSVHLIRSTSKTLCLGYLKSYIILPSTIYGLATHRLVKDGIANPHSIQIPSLIKAAVGRGEAGVVGKGVPIWPSVEINEGEIHGRELHLSDFVIDVVTVSSQSPIFTSCSLTAS